MMGSLSDISSASALTLGCRLNQAESALMLGQLKDVGIEIVSWGQPTDLLIINSCTVTGTAARKTRQTVRSARRRYPDATIVLTGCDVVNQMDTWAAVEAVDIVLGNDAKARFVLALAESMGKSAAQGKVSEGSCCTKSDAFIETGVGFYGDRTRANLKIQEGCDFFCSYCIVPHVRGPARSRQWNDILREARELIALGHQEIVLTGVNLATYNDANRDLADLMSELLSLGDGFRLRLSSIEPANILPRIVAVMRQSSRTCRFLHLPLQYGEDKILGAMNRHCSVEQYTDYVSLAREQISGLCIGSDMIVGFPGESEASFSTCCATVSNLAISYLHVFVYSPRAGTAAAELAHRVPGDVAAERSRKLLSIGQQKADDFAVSEVGKCLEVLVEAKNNDGSWEGWSDNYLRVEISGSENGDDLSSNSFVKAKIISTSGGRRVIGQLV